MHPATKNDGIKFPFAGESVEFGLIRQRCGIVSAKQEITDILAKLIKKLCDFFIFELGDLRFDFRLLLEVILVVR